MCIRDRHGLALADKLTETNDGRAVQEECTSWIRLAHTWLESLFAGEMCIRDRTITPDDFRHLAKDFGVTLPEEFLYEK